MPTRMNILLRLGVFWILLKGVVLSRAGQDDSTPQGDCKSMLRGFIDGQLSSALGSLQIENLRKEYEKSISLQETRIEQLSQEIKDLKNDQGSSVNMSATYTIWGKVLCPIHAETIYSGLFPYRFCWRIALHTSGAAVEPVCLPPDQEWGIHTEGVDGSKAYMYGAEYEFSSLTDSRKNLHDYDVPCAVCRIYQRSIIKMFPGRKTCYPGWNMEYTGYLMAGYHGHKAASQYTCIDESPDVLSGTQQSQDGRLFYPVEASCGSLPCPPYVNGRELTCVVCSA